RQTATTTISPPLRSSGGLRHVTCLPGRGGIGDLGTAAHAFVDWLGRAGQTWWQILPLGPPGAGNSPYQCYSAFAGNPALISPELLYREGLIGREMLRGLIVKRRALRVDFGVSGQKHRMLAETMDRLRRARGKLRTLAEEFDQFCRKQVDWLEDYALFMAMKDQKLGAWQTWPRKLVWRERGAMAEARRELAREVDLHRLGQFIFFRQLGRLRKYAAD